MPKTRNAARVLVFPSRASRHDTARIFSVERPIVGRVAAARGHILVAWPESETHSLSVVENTAGYPVLSYAACEPETLEILVDEWVRSGALIEILRRS